MSYSILSPESKQQLEQERSRLSQDRQSIIASVTGEIDRLIQQIDSLLGETTAAVTSEPKQAKASKKVAEVAVQPTKSTKKAITQSTTKPTIKPTVQRKGKAKAVSSASASKVADDDKAKTQKGVSDEKPKKGKRKQQLFDAKQLKADFGEMSPTDALLHVMLQSPNQSFSTDEMIQELYDEFDEADLQRARKSVAGVFSRGMRFGKLEKIQEHPSRYRLVGSMASA